MLVRAVGQRHNKVSRLRMAPDPLRDPEKENMELAKNQVRLRAKAKKGDGSTTRKRSSYARGSLFLRGFLFLILIITNIGSTLQSEEVDQTYPTTKMTSQITEVTTTVSPPDDAKSAKENPQREMWGITKLMIS
jgi:hypothetical protein